MDKLGQRTYVISSPSTSCVKKVLKMMKGKKFKWAYFGENTLRAISLEKELESNGERIEIATMLQNFAKVLRQPYIDYIGKLSLQQNSLHWWASSLSEKSPYISKSFLHTCYVKTSIHILEKYSNNSLVFFVEKKSVRQAILKNLRTNNITLIENKKESFFGLLNDLLEYIGYGGYFLLENFYRIFISKYVYSLQKFIRPLKPFIWVQTFIDRRSFDKGGKYHETYFGGLLDYLRKTGHNVAIVPYVLWTVSYREAIANIKKSKELFLVPHSFLSIFDILHIFFITSINKPKRISLPKIEGIDISDIIYEDLKNDWIKRKAAIHMLYYYLVKNLKKKNIQIDTVIYTFENRTREKIMAIALREFYPSTLIVGYQHSTFSIMELNHFFSKHEANIIPLPDRIITNGRFAKDVFIKSGYPKEKVVQGGAIRYEYLLRLKVDSGHPKKNKPVILVALPIGKVESIELVWKILKAFEKINRYKVVIKCHPDMPFEELSRHLNLKLPEHFTVSDLPIAKLVKYSNVLVYTSSTTAIEAIAYGIPVIHVESEFTVDLDVLDLNPEARASARKASEIVKYVEAAIQLSKDELSKKKKKWNQIMRNMFGTVNESVYRLFLR